MAIWMELSIGTCARMSSESAMFVYRFFLGSEGSSIVSPLHDLNGEIRVILITTPTARLSSSAIAPRMATIHDAQVSFLIGNML